MASKHRLISLKPESLAEAGIPVPAKTLIDWRLRGFNAELFLKIGGRLLVDLDAWDALVDQEKAKVRK